MTLPSPIHYFAAVPDPRVARTRRHPLPDLLFIALCASLAGCDHFTEMEDWAIESHDWLTQHLDLPGGIPSHDTFTRVFARLDPDAFRQAFMEWIADLRAQFIAADGPQHLALDGKTARRSGSPANDQPPLHLVNVWASEAGLVLAQARVDGKGNEITALPGLLRLLDLDGCLVTADAMHCQQETARQIIDGGGDYLLALKRNQGALHADVKLFLDDVAAGEFPERPHVEAETFDADHGRQERRHYWCTSDIGWLRERHGEDAWAGLASIGMVEARRRAGGPGTPVTVTRRYFISSLPAFTRADAERFGAAVRSHWSIENGLHWVLDLAFREDECRVRTDHAPENLATLRQLALSLLKQDRQAKRGVKTRRKQAGWSKAYLETVLGL